MHSQLTELMQHHGSTCLAYSTLQDGLEQHLLPGSGYIAFARRRCLPSATLGLGEPVAAEACKAELFDDFLAQHPQAAFVQLRAASASLLAERGFYVNKMGSEMRIELGALELGGRRARSLRHALQSGEEAGLCVVELNDVGLHRAALEQICTAWQKRRPQREHEYAFLSRSARLCDEPGVRKFAVQQGTGLLAFAFFDPVYRDGRTVAYAASVLRAQPMPGFSLQDLVVLRAMEQFAREGIEALNLGLMPFHALGGSDEIRPSAATRMIFETIYRRGSMLANCAGLSFHKSRYGGREIPVYFASRNALPLAELYACSRLTGLRPLRQLIHFGFESIPRMLSFRRCH